MEKSQSLDYLTSLLNKSLRITTTDKRMFLGQFKCTDSDRNVILSSCFEYRLPPPPKASFLQTETIKQDLTSRYLGLVVVPGTHIVKIEVEEFASQVKGKRDMLREKMRGAGAGQGMERVLGGGV